MQPAQAVFGPVENKSCKLIDNFVWNSQTSSSISRVLAAKISHNRFITLNFNPPEYVVDFCNSHGFALHDTIAGPSELIGSLTLSSPTDMQKACSLLFETCKFTQDADKQLLKKTACETPQPKSLDLLVVRLDIDPQFEKGKP